MYAPDHTALWNLPKVVVEHENSHSLDAFRFDHWKTLLAAAPLRVAIGYCSRSDDRTKWVGAINDTAKTAIHGWSLRHDVEDLIALGYWGMPTGGNYAFWRRKARSVTWEPMTV